MTKFKVIKDASSHFTLDVSEFKHIFVCEDETCAEISVTKRDLGQLACEILKVLTR